MQLEWDGNEVNIDGFQNISDMLEYGLGIIAAWKNQMISPSVNEL